MSRVLKHIETGATDQHGWFFLQLHEGGPDRRMVCVRCEHCGTTGRLVAHSIETNGEVQASINCCEAGHDFYRLEDWPSDLHKPRGEEFVRSKT